MGKLVVNSLARIMKRLPESESIKFKGILVYIEAYALVVVMRLRAPPPVTFCYCLLI